MLPWYMTEMPGHKPNTFIFISGNFLAMFQIKKKLIHGITR